MKKQTFNKGEIIIYETSKKEVELKVRMENETVWLTQAQIAKLYGKDRTVITKHINNIFKDKEVDEKSNVQKMHIAFFLNFLVFKDFIDVFGDNGTFFAI